MKKTSKPIKMFALVNCGTVRHVSYYRRDCVAAGRECFKDPKEYDQYVRNGWFKVVPCQVLLPASPGGDKGSE